MTDKTPRGGPSGDGPSNTSPRSGWLTKPRSPQRELPDLIEGDLSQEYPRALREATRKLFPLRSSDPLDTAGGRTRITTSESLSGKNPQEQLCDGCGKPSDGVLTGNQNGQYLCNACFGPGALVQPAKPRGTCPTCRQELPA